MVIAIELVLGQLLPFVLQVIVYTPSVLVDKMIVPVAGLMDNPVEGTAENTPPGKPVIVGVGLVPD